MRKTTAGGGAGGTVDGGQPGRAAATPAEATGAVSREPVHDAASSRETASSSRLDAGRTTGATRAGAARFPGQCFGPWAIGTEGRSPTGEAACVAGYREVFAALNATGSRYVVVGGTAVVLQGHPRMTVDLDLDLVVDLADVRALERLRSGPTR